MLVKCPECELQVSDKAYACPHCGYPMKPDVQPRKPRNKNNKRKRLPNGFGQISEIKNRNLRNPFRAMVTVGKSSTGRPICKPLKPESFFPTYNDAYAALVEYNRNPYDLEDSITVFKLYERWSKEYFSTLKAPASIRTITSAWAYCSSVYDMRVSDLRVRHIKGCMEDGIAVIRGVEKKPSAGTKSRIKSLFNLMLDYALEYELVDKNYARTFEISKDVLVESEETKNGHIPFTTDELDLLWNNIDKFKYVDVVLFQCYSGWRPQELGLLRIEDVNLNDGYIIGGMKTDAGRDRIVPIHPKVRDIVQNRYNEAISINSPYLINCTDSHTHKGNIKFTYSKYYSRFEKIVKALKLNPEHRPHDGRKTFVTLCKKAELDEYAIKYMVGHEIYDITEKVYTQREISWFKEEIEKIV